MRSFPAYFRTCCPRKSNPCVICVIWVFASESSRPRSRRKCSTSGLTSCSSTACELPVIMKSRRLSENKYPPAKPEVLRLLAPQRGLTAIAKSKPKTEKTTNGRLPELSNFESPPAEPGVYHDAHSALRADSSTV